MIISLHRHKDDIEQRLEKFAKEQWQMIRVYLQSRYSITNEESSDVFQDSLILLWKNIKENKVDIDDCIGTPSKSNAKYFMTICRNKTMELLRSKSKLADLSYKQDQDKDIIQFLPDKVETILALDEDYNKYQEEKEALVNTIISNLPSPCDKLLWGYYGNGYSLRELSSMYYKSEGYVKVTKHRCAKKFREKFNVEYKKIINKYDDIYRRYSKRKRPSK